MSARSPHTGGETAPSPRDPSEVLLRVANLLASTQSLEPTLDQVAAIVRSSLSARRCTILLLDPERRTLQPAASAAARRDPALFQRFREMPPIELERLPGLRRTLSRKRALVIPDARDGIGIPKGWVEAFRLQSLVLVPMRQHGESTGLLVIEYRRGTRVTPKVVRTLEAVAQQAAMVISDARAREELMMSSEVLAEQVMRQSVLLDVSLLLGTALDLGLVLQKVAESLATVLPVTYCRIATWDPRRRVLTVAAGYSRRGGADDVLVGHVIDPRRSPWHAQVLKHRTPLVVTAGEARGDERRLTAGTQSLLLLPMMGENRFFGIISIGEVRTHSRSPFGPDRVAFYRTLSSQAALAIEKAELFREREAAYWSAIDAIASVVEARDMGTHEHVYRVSGIAVELAKRIGVEGRAMVAVQRASVLHDFGKIAIPDRVLLKPGKLTPAEWEEMRHHSSVGSQLLGRIPFLEDAIPMVRHHHESWDGSGYPDHLVADEIPMGSRIIAVADTFDAMTTDRPYRQALPSERAFEEITTRAGIQFDPMVAAAFAEAYEDGGLRRSVREIGQRALQLLTGS